MPDTTEQVAGHTPGPWVISYAPNAAVESIEAPDSYGTAGAAGSIVRKHGIGMPACRAGQANARLISAAPDLLAAAKRALSVLKSQGESVRPNNVLGALSAAIAKAEGGAS